jgi:hypothetical protein
VQCEKDPPVEVTSANHIAVWSIHGNFIIIMERYFWDNMLERRKTKNQVVDDVSYLSVKESCTYLQRKTNASVTWQHSPQLNWKMFANMCLTQKYGIFTPIPVPLTRAHDGRIKHLPTKQCEIKIISEVTKQEKCRGQRSKVEGQGEGSTSKAGSMEDMPYK